MHYATGKNINDKSNNDSGKRNNNNSDIDDNDSKCNCKAKVGTHAIDACGLGAHSHLFCT